MIVDQMFEESPSGQTPLCHHIQEVILQIRAMEPELRRNRQLACVIIATDGESTDGNIADAMRPLQALPVWVVSEPCSVLYVRCVMMMCVGMQFYVVECCVIYVCYEFLYALCVFIEFYAM